MNYRILGKTGIRVSEIGFGGWALGGNWGNQKDEDSISALHKAIDLGINFIDTAAGYGDGRSERVIGKALKTRRDKVYVATKIPAAPGTWPPSPYCTVEDRYSEKYLRTSLEERLKNLDTDCIDVLQLHTWTRAWNRSPEPLETLKKFRKEGKIRFIGMSTPEHDQNCVIDLMRNGYLDTVQVIYNLFEQEPVAELLPVAREHHVGTIVRVAFDEGILTGKYTAESVFAVDDFRSRYFRGDRLVRTLERVENIKKDIAGSGFTLPQAALKFSLSHEAVSTVVVGIRNITHAAENAAVSDLKPLPKDLLIKLRRHNWRKAFWYEGK